MIIQKSFYYIRHGQTDWNLERRFQGQTDIPLNDTGIAQAQAAKSLLQGCAATHIYASPLKRARVTADIINQGMNLPITEIPNLQEVRFGVLEGQIADRKIISDEWRSGLKTPEGAESYAGFTARVFAALNEILQQDSIPLIVAHGAVFWPIHEHMQLGLATTLENAQPVFVEPNGQGWQMEPLS